jgi:hypothetical protein
MKNAPVVKKQLFIKSLLIPKELKLNILRALFSNYCTKEYKQPVIKAIIAHVDYT